MSSPGQNGSGHGDGDTPHVVIVGGGFGGLAAAQGLARAPVKITLIDRLNHHLFQPLLYQVATAGLSPAEIAMPIRSILRRQANTSVLLANVEAVDLDQGVVRLARSELPYTDIKYDYLVMAPGARTSYFGKDGWRRHAVGLKTIDDALEIRRRVLLAFEAAEREQDKERRRRLLNFVVIGGGPTGVELAGALAELSRFVLARDFHEIDLNAARVVLLEGGDRLLPAFPPELPLDAMRRLEGMGVQVHLNSLVTGVTREGVSIGKEFIPCATMLWAAGIGAEPVAQTMGVPLDRAGRIAVEPDLSIPGHGDAFVIGDAAAFSHGTGGTLPALAPVALQQGRFVARAIGRAVRGGEPGAFSYRDKGTLSTIGRKAAIADLGWLRLTGFVAWVAWLLVHIMYLVGFRNRAVVLFQWAWSYFTYQRGARLITGGRIMPGTPPEDEEEESEGGGEGPDRGHAAQGNMSK